MKFRTLCGALVAAMAGGLLVAPPVQADHAEPGDHVYGHRCRTYTTRVTNENTPAAVADTAEMPGAICEIDAVRIADGTVIAWHDARWRRVANHSTLPAGVLPTDKVTEATWDQVQQIRTKGGEPVARLEDMIAAAARYDIPLIVDIRNRLRREQEFVDLATSLNADVRYYQLLLGNCTHRNIDFFRDAGAQVGIKLLGTTCTPSPEEIEAMGATFTQQSARRLTDEYIADSNARGIAVGTLSRGMTEEYAEELVARGVSRVLLDRPKDALTWFDGPN